MPTSNGLPSFSASTWPPGVTAWLVKESWWHFHAKAGKKWLCLLSRAFHQLNKENSEALQDRGASGWKDPPTNHRHPSQTRNKPLCLLRNLYAGQEATVRTGQGTTYWFQIGKEVCQGCILSPCLFNLYAEYIRRNAGLNEVQAGIKISRRNINNLRYADDTTLMEESIEELKSLLMTVKDEDEKVGLKLNIQKTNIMASCPSTPWANTRGNSVNSDKLYFAGLRNHCRWWLQPRN